MTVKPSILVHSTTVMFDFFKCKCDSANSNQLKDKGHVGSRRKQINPAQVIPLHGIKIKSK